MPRPPGRGPARPGPFPARRESGAAGPSSEGRLGKMKTVRALEKGVNALTLAFGYIAALALLFNMGVIVADVFCRYVLKSAIIGSNEYVQMGQTVLIFLALGYAQRTGGLVHVAFFMKKLPGIAPVVVWMLHAWVASAVCALLAYASWIRIPFVKQATTSLLIPFRPFYYVMAAGFLVYALAQLFEAVRTTIGLFNKEVRREVVESWPA